MGCFKAEHCTCHYLQWAILHPSMYNVHGFRIVHLVHVLVWTGLLISRKGVAFPNPVPSLSSLPFRPSSPAADTASEASFAVFQVCK